MFSSIDPSYTHIERIATLIERASTQQKYLDEIKKDLDDQKQFNKNILKLIESIQAELTGRKEYLRGFKVGIALFWLLLGGAIITVINKVFYIGIGFGG